jgi:omega-6 fatty acid desaturase (delta-12 desaturase)
VTKVLGATDAGAIPVAHDVVHAEKRSLTRGLLIFAGYSVLYAATLIDAVAPFPLAINIAAGIGNGICIAMLYIVGHDCCHGALVPGRQWNLWLGRLAFVPVVHSVSLWRLTHNRNHHGRTNLKGVDSVWPPMSPKDYAQASAPRRALERVYRSALGPLIYYQLDIWLPLMIAPISKQARAEWKRHVPDTIFVLLGFAFTLAVIHFLGAAVAPERSAWLTLLLGWGVPFAAFNYLAAITVYLNHTHPEIPWFDKEEAWSFYNGSVLGTAHVKIPFDIFPLYTDVMAHPAHHANAGTPVYALPAEQAALKARVGGDSKEYTLSLGEYRRILAACKLFDYDRMCWTDFDGVPTGPVLEVRPADYALNRAKSFG